MSKGSYDRLSKHIWADVNRRQYNVRIFWRFVRLIDASKMRDLAGVCALAVSLGITPDAFVKGRIHENLHELIILQ